MVFRCPCKPGVPAITRRNGAFAATGWLAFQQHLPHAQIQGVGLVQQQDQRSATTARRDQGCASDRSASSQPSLPMPMEKESASGAVP